jgi:hypothetical protein
MVKMADRCGVVKARISPSLRVEKLLLQTKDVSLRCPAHSSRVPSLASPCYFVVNDRSLIHEVAHKTNVISHKFTFTSTLAARMRLLASRFLSPAHKKLTSMCDIVLASYE